MNCLHQGDNLTILRNMPDASVDLICTDPPFNTGKDWGAFNDKWEGGLKGYLKFMAARVVEMRRVLKSTGSLYLHCDPTASHYLKVMLDGVFGIKQFRNEIVWCYVSAGSPKRFFKRNHDVVFLYTDNPIWTNYRIPYKQVISSLISKTGCIENVQGKSYTYSADKGQVPNDYWDIPIVIQWLKNALATQRKSPWLSTNV